MKVFKVADLINNVFVFLHGKNIKTAADILTKLGFASNPNYDINWSMEWVIGKDKEQKTIRIPLPCLISENDSLESRYCWQREDLFSIKINYLWLKEYQEVMQNVKR